jgi:hypothetical protein
MQAGISYEEDRRRSGGKFMDGNNIKHESQNKIIR